MSFSGEGELDLKNPREFANVCIEREKALDEVFASAKASMPEAKWFATKRETFQVRSNYWYQETRKDLRVNFLGQGIAALQKIRESCAR